MAKTRTIFICQECGHQVSKWLGKCPECNSWSSFSEERQLQPSLSKSRRESGSSPPITINQVKTIQDNRVTTGIGEFDRVLGGGMVDGSLILIGGEPGIGKSTLTLQSMGYLARHDKKVLYVSG